MLPSVVKKGKGLNLQKQISLCEAHFLKNCVRISSRAHPNRNGHSGGVSTFWGTDHGGEGGIRTLDTGITPYNGLANRRLRPLGHLSSCAEPNLLLPFFGAAESAFASA